MSALVFPGQGSQYVNMSIDFNNNFKTASEVFQEIEDTTKINIRKIITENQQNKLNQTKYTQISIFAASMSIFITLQKHFLDKINDVKIVLGHSLGEYSALVANKCIKLSDAANLIKIRSELMHNSIQPNVSGMAAIIGKDSDFIENVINQNNLKIQIANDNSPLQVVVSGLLNDLETSEKIFISNGAKRFIKLNVSAAFHSNFMLDAQNSLISEINKISFNEINIPIISNFNAEINSDTLKIKKALNNQMASKVKWTDSIKKLEETDIKNIIEIGPGKVLSSLILRISKKFDMSSIDKIEDLKNLK